MAPRLTLCYAALLALTGLGAASCISPPDYSETPEISFNKIYTRRIDKITGVYDTVSVTVSFKDGDGDLGLDNTEADKQPPYSELIKVNGVDVPNKYYNNYFLTLQVQELNGQYSDLVLPFGYNSRYPRLEPESQGNRKAPLKGDLTFGLTISERTIQQYRPDLRPPNSVRFKVYIVDRALHESNVVTTDPITIQ